MSDIDISEPLSDMLAPLNNEQKEFLMNNYTIQTYKKNETIYCEGETPSHLMCLISGKVKIFKDGVGGRSQIIRMIKPREYFAYRAYFSAQDLKKWLKCDILVRKLQKNATKGIRLNAG